MNFLSHYHFFKTEDTYYNTGLVLPDLVRNFCKSHLKPGNSFNRPALDALNRGSMRHLEADKLFHNSAYFIRMTGFISEYLDPEAPWPRKWFLNHLLCEILTDRVLMDRQSGLCTEFYTQLEHTDPAQITLYLKLSGVRNYQNFAEAFQRFVSVRFIFEYMHNENIIRALSRVYARVGIAYEWTDADRSLLLRHIPGLLRYMDTQLQMLENDLK